MPRPTVTARRLVTPARPAAIALLRIEANAWRACAAKWCLAEKGIKHFRATPNYGDGLCLTYAIGLPGDLPFRHVICARMEERLRAAKPKHLRKSADYWFPTTTQAGRAKRIAVCLKLAAQCDKLAGDK